jgi:hypothetical protein
MGMSASQARLLSLTGRLHDVELKAQNIESQKIALATQEDEAYERYNDALDATKITVAFYGNNVASYNYVDATFNNLCTYQENRVTDYALVNNKNGKIIVSDDIVNAYENYGNDKYAFAWAALGFGENFAWGDEASQGAEIGIGESNAHYDDYGESSDNGDSLYMTECEAMVYENYKDEDSTLAAYYQAILDADGDSEKKAALETFRNYLYDNQTYKDEIFTNMNYNKNGIKGENYDVDFPDMTWDDIEDEFNYYVKLWSAINEAGGCESMQSQYKSGSDGATWLKNMVESGLVGIKYYNRGTSNKGWQETSVATSIDTNYLQEEQDDTDLKKAEAEYEHELSIINKKDAKFDNELSKLETERTSITTEIDALKQVRDDNVERTFGIFS